MSTNSEEYLIAQVILYDDHKAFERLIGLHQNQIRNLLLKLVNFNDRELDDLSQETIIRIYKHLKTFKGASSFTTWVYKIAYRVFIDAQKKKKKYHQLKANQKNTGLQATHDHLKIDNKIDAEIIISCLRPEEKVAIQLSYLKGFSHGDIAEVLDCPLGTVKSHIKRGKKELEKCINE